MNKNKIIIGGVITAITLAGGLTYLTKDNPIDIIGDQVVPVKNEIMRQAVKQEKTEGVLMSRVYQVEELDSVGGQIVIVKKDVQVFVTKKEYNQCRENQTKQECLDQLKKQLKNQIERDKERRAEEILEFEKQQIDFTNEITDQDLICQ